MISGFNQTPLFSWMKNPSLKEKLGFFKYYSANAQAVKKNEQRTHFVSMMGQTIG